MPVDEGQHHDKVSPHRVDHMVPEAGRDHAAPRRCTSKTEAPCIGKSILSKDVLAMPADADQIHNKVSPHRDDLSVREPGRP